MAQAALIVIAVIFAVLIIISSIYFLVYFQHPDDKLVAWFPKFVVVTGLCLAAYNIFLLPLDIANQQGLADNPDAFDAAKVEAGFFITTCVYILAIVPFSVFFYEGYDDVSDSGDLESPKGGKSQLQYALKWTIPTLLFFGAAVATFYLIGGKYAVVPRVRMAGYFFSDNYVKKDLLYLNGYADENFDPCSLGKSYASVNGTQMGVYVWGSPQGCVISQEFKEEIVSPVIYLIALISVLGYVFFSVFGGIGLIALPFDCILGFIHRPKPIGTKEYQEKKKIIGEQAKLLMEAGTFLTEEVKQAGRRGKSLLDKSERRLRKKEQEFRKDVLILEYHFQWLEDAYKNQGGNFILQFASFLFGCFGCILSLCWVIHVIVYIIPVMMGYDALDPFLNNFFMQVGDVPFIGVVIYAMFSFYLMACVIKGTIKLGMRILFFTVHPMKVGETMMNSLLFNTGIILISSISIVQFLSLAFAEYASYTAASAMFNVKIQNLKGLNYGWDIFVFLFIFMALCTLVYVIYKPYHKQRENNLMKFKRTIS